ncbi:MAG: D-glycero-beta-D-manno-heptose-7-phosphate kinase [Candidatus Eisenbacteria bacterium]
MEQKIESARAREILTRFRGRRFLVVGDLMLDRYVFGDVDRISPEAPVPVVKVTRTEERLGGAANVANNLAALGADVSLCGVIGDDRDGESVRRDLEGRNIDSALLVRDPERPTTRKIRIIAHQQQVVRVDHERDEPMGAQVEERLIRNIGGRIAGVDGVILSDYGKGVVGTNTIRAVVEGAGRDVRTFVDPKVRHFSLYRGVSLVTPNLAEASLAAGEKIVDDGSLMRAGARLLEMLPGTTILLTRGSEGMSLFEPNGLVTHIGTVARRVFDVTGAGDTVISAFAMAVAAGAVGLEAAILSNLAAGVVVQEAGAATVSVDALERVFEED